MTTFLFENIVFGPVNSRRLGKSLGINLISNTCKLCTFDCLYCECGWTTKQAEVNDIFPKVSVIAESLEKELLSLKSKNIPLDVITFAGNGEPTMHPEFEQITNEVIRIKNKIDSELKIAVLSNATLLQKPSVINALLKVDYNIQKLDGGNEEIIKTINQPIGEFNLNELINHLLLFKGNLIIQTLFLKGRMNGIEFDNTNDKEIKQWLSIIKKIRPKQVMIYSLDRHTPQRDLEKTSEEKLLQIARLVEKEGIETLVTA